MFKEEDFTLYYKNKTKISLTTMIRPEVVRFYFSFGSRFKKEEMIIRYKDKEIKSETNLFYAGKRVFVLETKLQNLHKEFKNEIISDRP